MILLNKPFQGLRSPDVIAHYHKYLHDTLIRFFNMFKLNEWMNRKSQTTCFKFFNSVNLCITSSLTKRDLRQSQCFFTHCFRCSMFQSYFEVQTLELSHKSYSPLSHHVCQPFSFRIRFHQLIVDVKHKKIARRFIFSFRIIEQYKLWSV